MPTARTVDQIRRDHPGLHAVNAVILAMIEAAAVAGEMCPSNMEIVDRLSVSQDTVCKRFAQLAASRLIEIEKTKNGRRRVHIVASGLTTASVTRPAPATVFAAVNPWSEEDDAKLRALYLEGARVADIADALGRSIGSTSSRIYRLIDTGGLPNRAPGKRPSIDQRLKGAQNKAATNAAKKEGKTAFQPSAFGPRLPPLGAKPVDLDPRAGILPPATACAWFVGPRDGDWRLQVCCGQPVEPGKPYCAHHQGAAWRAGTSAALYVPATIGGDRTVRHGHRRAAVVAY